MDPVSRQFDDLEEAVDSMHALFRCWEVNTTPPNASRLSMLHRTKLAIHEWLANLIQHADFQNRTPTVQIKIQPVRQQIRCVVEDNSQGFTLPAAANHDVFEALPERGMGLQIIEACTEHVSYEAVCTHLHRLEFCVSTDRSHG